MNRVIVLRSVNMTLALSFLLQVMTVIIIVFHITTPDPQLVFEIHEYNGILMVLLVCTHITLNWGWIKANFFKKK